MPHDHDTERTGQRRRNATLGAIGVLALTACVASLGALAPVDGQATPGGVTPGPAPEAGTSRQFEVASVKPNKSGDNRVLLGNQPGGRFTATNVSLRQLIVNAYRIQATQLVGAPDWANSERFDIVAKAEGDPGPDGTNEMMRSLLAERFGLKIHRETRDLPIYVLMLARADGKLGDKLKPSTTDCAAMFARGRGRGAMPLPAPPTPGQPMVCGARMGPGMFSAGGTSLSQLATSLGVNVGRIVQDKTGLSGNYDVELSWTPERGAGPGGPPGAATPLGPGGADGSGVSIFTAVQEQLGLKLESQRGPVEVVVIDSVSQPTPD